jgi:hypothetical protein
MLPGSGYLVIALKADNPGAWLQVPPSVLPSNSPVVRVLILLFTGHIAISPGIPAKVRCRVRSRGLMREVC